jgi:hypothetical protein
MRAPRTCVEGDRIVAGILGNYSSGLGRAIASAEFHREFLEISFRGKKWLHKFGRCGRWIGCLTAGTVVLANQERR